MFTVLVRYRFNDNQILFSNVSTTECKNFDRLIMSFSDGSQTVLHSGEGAENDRDVFVMNSSGATVARFNL